ncbi:hypothetical protein, variant [Blastomyces gilchristii SLH14081]|uniref:Uncharacterized protein n=1 Tax=Blastomyces gilchristii (strain SLH14081) TaxID=559298 RepID=A0A179V4Y2_BLAGS|nr:hypothetical protein, variant [Blastomyces gilchristii SLH14081]OAT14538.1 hypothetical protein, variant [Blastomyces gilchristii SLH14081]
MGQIGKGGTRVRLGVGVLEHQRWTGFSRRSLLGYLHNYRSGIFQNREDWCIWLGHFTLQFGMRSAMGSECLYDRGLFDGSIGGFLFEKSSEFVVERFWELTVDYK